MKLGSMLVDQEQIPVAFYLEHITGDSRNEYCGRVTLRYGAMTPELTAHLEQRSSVILAEHDGIAWAASIQKIRSDGFTFCARPLRQSAGQRN